jgi:hypothetical protein
MTLTSGFRFAEEEWEEIRRRGAYEDGYYFVSQLFEEGWQPRSMD